MPSERVGRAWNNEGQYGDSVNVSFDLDALYEALEKTRKVEREGVTYVSVYLNENRQKRNDRDADWFAVVPIAEAAPKRSRVREEQVFGKDDGNGDEFAPAPPRPKASAGASRGAVRGGRKR